MNEWISFEIISLVFPFAALEVFFLPLLLLFKDDDKSIFSDIRWNIPVVLFTLMFYGGKGQEKKELYLNPVFFQALDQTPPHSTSHPTPLFNKLIRRACMCVCARTHVWVVPPQKTDTLSVTEHFYGCAAADRPLISICFCDRSAAEYRANTTLKLVKTQNIFTHFCLMKLNNCITPLHNQTVSVSSEWDGALSVLFFC